ncbi:MAG TPA: DUF1822 family protein [Oculatellaceae cyanobacterium]
MNSQPATDSVTIPLSFTAHSLAQEISNDLSNPIKKKQVYLNTLAVYAVEHYLRCLGFNTDRLHSDSYNPVMVKLMNIADLNLTDIGRIECRPVLPNANHLEIPAEVLLDRIGYVAVQLSEDLKSANILGFTSTAAAEVSLNDLQSVEDLLIYLSELEPKTNEVVTPSKESELVNLGKWFDGIISTGWETIDQLLNPLQLGVAFKKQVSVTRGKKINLGMLVDNLSVALVVKLTSQFNQEVEVLIQLYPTENLSLVEGIKLIVSDESGEVLDQAISRSGDNWIQLELSAELGEKFSVIVGYDEVNVRQDFVLDN